MRKRHFCLCSEGCASDSASTFCDGFSQTWPLRAVVWARNCSASKLGSFLSQQGQELAKATWCTSELFQGTREGETERETHTQCTTKYIQIHANSLWYLLILSKTQSPSIWKGAGEYQFLIRWRNSFIRSLQLLDWRSRVWHSKRHSAGASPGKDLVLHLEPSSKPDQHTNKPESRPGLLQYFEIFFPRASERRVLLIVGVCQTFSHLHITSSNLHIFSSSHTHIFASSHLHTCSSSHLLIFTSSHLHTLSSSHLHIFSSSHLFIVASSHIHILTSSHLLICTSSHPHILTSSLQPHIFTSSHLHICSSSHLHIFSSSHLHTFSPSHLHIFNILSCPLALLPSCSCPLALSFFSISLLRRGQCHEQRDGNARNATLSHETRFDRQKLR